MDEDLVEHVRLAIYREFARTGHAPDPVQIAALADVDPAELSEALARLAAMRHLALDANGSIVMAHPFTSLNLGFSVMGRDRLWWGGCAWDSFAIPNLVADEPRVLVATACPGCDRPLAWYVSNTGPPTGEEVAHFLVPMSHVWDDVVQTCSNQRLFCTEGCVDSWLTATGRSKGYVMDLSTLWRLAQDWYTGRLESPYVRRDPEAAKEYFRSVGLRGSFWGIDP